jgi:hypothetical protein
MSKATSNPSPNRSLLTEDDRERIRADEAFRAELREEFAKPKQSRWWMFLNSPFGLWFLGSVTLASITGVYNSIASARQANAERAAAKIALLEELEMRFTMAHYAIQIDASDKTNPKLSQKELDELVLNEVNGQREILHPEFHGVPASTLFSRLIRLSNKPKGYVNLGEYNWRYFEPKLRMAGSSAQEVKNRLDAISTAISDLDERPK